MQHPQFNKKEAQKHSKADWIKKLAHLAADFDLPKIWEELQEGKKEEEKK